MSRGGRVCNLPWPGDAATAACISPANGRAPLARKMTDRREAPRCSACCRNRPRLLASIDPYASWDGESAPHARGVSVDCGPCGSSLLRAPLKTSMAVAISSGYNQPAVNDDDNVSTGCRQRSLTARCCRNSLDMQRSTVITDSWGRCAPKMTVDWSGLGRATPDRVPRTPGNPPGTPPDGFPGPPPKFGRFFGVEVKTATAICPDWESY